MMSRLAPQNSYARKSLFSRPERQSRKKQTRLLLEHLEDRVLLAVRVWTGAGLTGRWTDAANWQGEVAPAADDNLIFPAGVIDKAAHNDYAAGTSFRTITISDSGYAISGNSVVLLDGLLANQVAGESLFGLPVILGGAETFDVANPQGKLVVSDIHTGNLLQLTVDGPGTLQVGDGTASNPGVISGTGGLNKIGTGTTYLYGDNSYEGVTTISQGVINVRHDRALGAVSGITMVNGYAALHLEGGRTMNEPLYLGSGFGVNIDLDTGGSIRSLGSGITTYSGQIVAASGEITFGVDQGGRLRIDGPIISDHTNSDSRLIKMGPGTLELFGNQSNQMTGSLRVMRGTVELNKSDGALAVNGDIEVGEYMTLSGQSGQDYGIYGGDDAARLLVLQDHQFPYRDYLDTSIRTVTLYPSARMELGENVQQTIGHLVMYLGQRWSADLDIGATGTLTMLGNLTVTGAEGSSVVTPAATITGNRLDLGWNWSGQVGSPPAAYRTFAVNDTALSNAAVDLRVDAVIAGPADVPVYRSGTGTLELNAANAYLGPTLLYTSAAGITVMGNDQAFGTGPIYTGDHTLMTNGHKRTVANLLTSDNDLRFASSDIIGYGSVAPDRDDFVFTGTVTQPNSDRNVMVFGPTQTVTFAGLYTEGTHGSRSLSKYGRGTLVFSGDVRLNGDLNITGDSGTVRFEGTAVLPGTASSNPDSSPHENILIGAGARLVLDNTKGNLSDRIPDLRDIRITGGTLELIGADGEASSEKLGLVTYLNYSASDLVSRVGTGPGSSAKLIVNTLDRHTTGSSINFRGAVKQDDAEDGSLSAQGRNQIVLGGQILSGSGGVVTVGGLFNGILPSATVQSSQGQYDLATWVSDNEGLKIQAYTDYVTDINVAGPTSNVKLTTDAQTVTRSINALILGPGVSLTGASTTTALTVNAGNLILGSASGLDTAYLNLVSAVSGYAFDSLWTVAADAQGAGNEAAITGVITGAPSITKAGTGKLILEPRIKGTGELTNNEFTGNFVVDEGIVNIRHGGALGAGPGTGSGYTIVMNQATLELEDVGAAIEVPQEYLRIHGTGFQDQGVLRNLSGTSNVWSGQVTHVGFGDYSAIEGWSLFGAMNASWIRGQFVDVAEGSKLTIGGPITGDGDLIKLGKGTLELNGSLQNTANRAIRVKEGTLLFNKADGLLAHASNGWLMVGDDDPATAPATVRFLANGQIHPDAFIRVASDGTLDLNNTRQIVENFDLTIGPQGGGQILLGATGEMMLESGSRTIAVHTLGTGHSNGGARIEGGKLALSVPGVQAIPTTTFLVNRGLSTAWPFADAAVDLVVSSALSDGSGLINAPVTKAGYGSMEFSGTEANTYSGTTTVARGTLLLNKNVPGHPGAALGGGLAVGDEDWASGGRLSDIVRVMRPGQIPDMTVPMQYYYRAPFASNIVRGSGWLDVLGFDASIGGPNFQSGLLVAAGSLVTTGGGTLAINGNLQESGGWPFAPAEIIGNLSFNTPSSATRTIDVGDHGSLQYELVITGSITAPESISIIKGNTGGLLLLGDSTATLASDIYHQGGILGVGHDGALGSKDVYLGSSVNLAAEEGPRTIANFLSFDGTNYFGSTGSGGGNNLTVLGGATLTGSRTLYVNRPTTITIAGPLGESYGSASLTKGGLGTLVLEGPAMHSGNTEVTWSGGALVLREQGTLENTGAILVRSGGTLAIEANPSSGSVDRIRDLTPVTLYNGTLLYRGAAGQNKFYLTGALTVATNYGGTVITEVPATGSINLTFPSLTVNPGSTINFVGLGEKLGTVANRILFTTAPLLVGGILPYGLMTTQRFAGGLTQVDLDFVTYAADGIAAAPYVADINLAGPTDNVKLQANQTLLASQTVNALLLQGANVTLAGPGQTLTVRTGSVLTGADFNTIATHTLDLDRVSLQRTPYVFTDRKTTVQIASSLAGNGPISTAGKGTVVLAGDNTFTGALTVTEGIVRVSNDTGLGSTVGGTQVVNGAQLQVQGPRTIGDEPLTLTGVGVGQNNMDWTGALRLLPHSGTVVWGTGATPFVMAFGGNPLGVTVEDVADRLVLDGTVNFNADATGRYFYKLGAGTLELRGTAGNTQTNNPNFQVNSGTLALNKGGTGLALPAPAAVVVGDDCGEDDADQLVLANNNQIHTSAAIHVRSSGLWDLAGHDQALAGGTALIYQLYLYAGPLGAGDVSLGGGTLTLGSASNITAIRGYNFAGGGPVGTRIYGPAGNVHLGTTVSSGVVIQIDDGAARHDFRLEANLTGPGHLTRTQRDSGVVLSGDNSGWTGNLTAQSDDQTYYARGELWITRSEALGASSGGTVTVLNGQSLILAPEATATDIHIGNKTLSSEGAGLSYEGLVRSISGNNTWAGDWNLGAAAESWVNVDAGTLSINGAVSSGKGRAFVKTGPGTLVLGGSDSNKLNQNVYIYEGELQLNKTGGAYAVTGGRVQIGNDTGGPAADVLKLMASNQLQNTLLLVRSSGLVDMNDQNVTATGVDFIMGTVASGEIRTGTNPATTLTMAGSAPITLRQTGSNPWYTPPARISGEGVLDFEATLNNIDVADYSPIVELVIDTRIDASETSGFQKTNTGAMMLTADNAGYAGAINLNAGYIAVPRTNPLDPVSNAYGGSAKTITVNGGAGIFAYGGSVALPNPISLGNNLTVAGGTVKENLLSAPVRQDLEFQDRLTLSGGNRTVTVNNSATTIFSGSADSGGIAFDLGSGATAYAVTFDVRGQAEATVSGKIAETGSGTGSVSKSGSHGRLTLSGDNTYKGATTVANGYLWVQSPTALGAAAGNTTVNSGAVLAIDLPSEASHTITEPLVLNGTGFLGANYAYVPTGALRLADSTPAAADRATLTGDVTLNNANVGFGVQGAEDTLVLEGVVKSPNVTSFNTLMKYGPGSLELGGTTANTYLGGTFIAEGTLVLNKANNAVGAATGPGNIMVGDDVGSDLATNLGLDQLVYGSAAGTNQMGQYALLNVSSSGRVDFAGKSDSIGGLALATGSREIGGVEFGSSSLIELSGATVTLNGSSSYLIGVTTVGWTDGTTNAARVTAGGGQILLSAMAAPQIQINDTFVPSEAEDLVIEAPIGQAALPTDGTYLDGYVAGIREGRNQLYYFDDGSIPNSLLGGSRVESNIAMSLRSNSGITQPMNLGSFPNTNYWGNNETWVYSGQIYDADGLFQIAENIDDQVQIFIDGQRRLRNTNSFRIGTTASSTTMTGNTTYAGDQWFGGFTSSYGAGWHDIEIRMGNGTGNGGAVTDSTRGWTTALGLGYSSPTGSSLTPSWNGADYLAPRAGMNLASPADGDLRTRLEMNLTGTGTIGLTGANTFAHDLVVSTGTLTLRGGGSIADVDAIRVEDGARLVINDEAGTGGANRVGDDANLDLRGGTLELLANPLVGTEEVLGILNLGVGATGDISSSILVKSNAGGVRSGLSALGLTRAEGTNLDLVATGIGGFGSDVGLFFDPMRTDAVPPVFSGGVLPYATVRGVDGRLDLVTDRDPDGDIALGALQTYDTDLNTPGTGNYRLSTTPAALTDNRLINALLLDGDGISVDLAAFNLDVGSGLVVNAGTGNVITGAGTVKFGTSEAQWVVDEAGNSLAISTPMSGSGAVAKLGDGHLTLAGDNSGLTGKITVQRGTMRAAHGAALGAASAATRVARGAVVELDGNGMVMAEPFELFGGGQYDIVDNKFPGALVQVAGTTGVNTLTGTITLENESSNPTVVSLQVASGTLLVNGSIRNSTNFPTVPSGLTKYGDGRMELGDTAVNTMSGALTVADGTLILNKTADGAALPNGSLVVGDGRGGFRSDERVEYGASAHDNQLGGGGVTVARSGVFDAKGKNDSIGALTLQDGLFIKGGGNYTVGGINMTGGLVDANGTGSLYLANTLNYYGGSQGRVEGTLTLTGDRYFNVADGPALYDLDISADISSRRIEKQGTGVLLLRGNNIGLGAGSDRQTFSVATSVGSFNLSFAGFMTDSLPAGASAEAVKTALEALPIIGKDSVNVSVGGTTTIAYTVQFVNSMAGCDLPQLIVNRGDGSTATAGAGGGTASLYITGGILALGSDTAAGPGGMIMNTGGVWAYGGERYLNLVALNVNGGTFTIGGRREWGGTDPVYIGTALTWGSGVVSYTYQVDDPLTTVQLGGNTERQLIYFSTAPSSGTWKIKLSQNGAESAELPFNATVEQVHAALMGIADRPAGAEFLVEQGPGPFSFKVTFKGTLSNRDQYLLRIVETTNATVTVYEILPGGKASHASEATTNPALINPDAGIVFPYTYLNKTGAGTLVLGGPSAYSGQTTIAGGALVIKSDGALGDTYDYPAQGILANQYGRANVVVAGNAALVLDPRDELGQVMGPINITDRGLVTLVSNPPRYNAGRLGDFGGVVRNVAGDNTWHANTVSEVKTIKFSTGPTRGTWTINFNGATTSGIAFDADAATVQTRLQGITTISTNNVIVTGNTTDGFRVLFTGGMRNAPQNRFVLTLNQMTGVTATAIETIRGMDAFDMRALSNATTNDSTFFFGADAGRLELIGEVLSTASDGNYLSPGGSAARNSTRFAKVGSGTIAFGGEHANNYWGDTMVLGGTLELNKTSTRALPADTYLFVGDHADPFWDSGTDTILFSTPGQIPDNVPVILGQTGRLETGPDLGTDVTNEVQQIAFNVTPTTGTWSIRLNSAGTAVEVTDIPYYAGPDMVETMINQSAWGMTGNLVKVSGSTSLYVFTFLGNAAGKCQAPIEVPTKPGTVTATVTRTSLGGVVGTESIGTLTGRIGGATSSQIHLGSGQLSLGGDATFSLFPGTITTVGAVISGPGKLGLINSTATAAGNRTITVNASGAAEELLITAPLADGSVAATELQTIAFRSAPSGGTWKISYGTETTSAIARDANAAAVATALNAILPGSNAVSVTTVGNTYTYAVTFLGDRALGFVDVDALQIDTSSLIGGGGVEVIESLKGGTAGVSNEVQTIDLPGGLTRGTWWISYDGQTTEPLPYDATVAEVQSALENLSNIEVGDVKVYAGTDFVVVFQGTLAGIDVPRLELWASNFAPEMTAMPSSVETIRGGQAPYAAGLIRLGQMGSRMTLAADAPSTYQGMTTVGAGALNIQHGQSLGADNNGTFVATGAAIEVQGSITVSDETLNLNGVGAPTPMGDRRMQSWGATLLNSGALRSLGGNNVWESTRVFAGTPGNLITLAGATSINVREGSLTIRGPIAQGGNLLAKIGDGSLEMASVPHSLSSANTGSGSAHTVVMEGELVLNKSAGDQAVPISLYVGDDRSPDSTARVRYGSAAGANQINDNATVIARGGGKVDLSTLALGEVQTVTLPAAPIAGSWALSYDGYWTKPLAFNASAAEVEAGLNAMLKELEVAGAAATIVQGANPWIYQVQFGGSLVGQDLPLLQAVLSSDFFPVGNVTIAETVKGGYENISAVAVNVGRGGAGTIDSGSNTMNLSSSTPITAYTVGGSLSYQAGTIAGRLSLNHGSRTLRAWDNPGDLALDISAVIIDGPNPVGAASSLTKLGGGTAVLRGASTYSGTTTIQEGMLVAGGNAAFGSAAGSTVVWNSAQLGFTGGFDYTTAENIQLGTAALPAVTMINLAGDNRFGGMLGSLAPVVIDSRAGGLTITGTLGAAESSVRITGAGYMAVEGMASAADLVIGNAQTTVSANGMLSFDTLAVAAGSQLEVNGTGGNSAGLIQVDGSIHVGQGSTLNFASAKINTTGSAGVEGQAGNAASTILVEGGMEVAETGLVRYDNLAASGIVRIDGIAEGTLIQGQIGSQVTGTGTVRGDLNAAGMLGGGVMGALTVEGATILADSATFAIQVGQATEGGYGQLDLVGEGALSLGGAELQVNLSGSFVPAAGDSFTVVENGTGLPVTGQFCFGGVPLANGDGFEVPVPGGGTLPLRIFYNSGAGNDVILVRQAPLEVTSIRLDAGPADGAGGESYAAETGQRSVITRAVVTFNGIVDRFDSDAFNLYAQGSLADQGKIAQDRQGFVPINWISQRIGQQTVATITFGNSGEANQTYDHNGVWSLNDDNYELRVQAAQVINEHGDGLVSNIQDQFFRWFGDADGDRDTDGANLFRFRTAAGSEVGTYTQAFDYNGDGNVDNADYLQLRASNEGYLRFGSRLLP